MKDKKTPKWAKKLWKWADRCNIPVELFPRELDQLVHLTVLDLYSGQPNDQQSCLPLFPY